LASDDARVTFSDGLLVQEKRVAPLTVIVSARGAKSLTITPLRPY